MKMHLTPKCVSCSLSFQCHRLNLSIIHLSCFPFKNTNGKIEKWYVTYNFVRAVDLLQLFSNISRSIWASIIYDYNFIVDSTKIKNK